MSDFLPVTTMAELVASGNKLCCEFEDHYLVLVAIGSEVYCLDDVCTHDGGPLGEGELEGTCLVCPRHGAKFDVRTGAATCMPATEPTPSHEVRVSNGTIYVKLVR